MSDSWNTERQRLILALIVAVLAGLLSDYWLLSFLIVAITYLAWHLVSLSRFTEWLSTGARLGNAPEMSGAWDRAVWYVYRIKKRHKKRKERMNRLLARFEEVAMALPDATVVLKTDNEIEWSNKVAERLLGIRSPEDAGQRIENLIRTPAFQVYLKNGRFDEPLNINSPRNKNIELSLRIIPFGDGERLLTARDISSFVRVQAMRRDFVANVSHEMRTPLTVMTGYLEPLLDDERLDSEYREILRSIQRQSQRMQAIVEDLLHLSRLESDLAEQENTEVQIPKLLNTLAREVEHLATESGHEITLALNEKLHLMGVAYELNSVFTNLLHNALRHTPRGTRVEIYWDIDEEGRAVLSVNDNGPGIPAKHVPRLTERFYRVDEGRSRDTGGTGLGLAIVKHIVQRHDGVFDIQSQIGVGSRFICRFSPKRAVLKIPQPEKAGL